MVDSGVVFKPYWVRVKGPKAPFTVGQVVTRVKGGIMFFCSTLPRRAGGPPISTPKILDTVVVDHLLALEEFRLVAVHVRGSGVVYQINEPQLRAARHSSGGSYRFRRSSSDGTRDYLVIPFDEWQRVTVKEPFDRPKVAWDSEKILDNVEVV